MVAALAYSCFTTASSSLACVLASVSFSRMGAAPPPHSAGAARREFQFVLALLAGGQAVGDGLLAFFQRLHDRRPHELHAEPHEQDEGDGLPDQGCVDIHFRTPEI